MFEDSVGNDIFFDAGTVKSFGADALGGQNLVEMSPVGVTAASFGTAVKVLDLGVDVQMTIGTLGSFLLQGVGDWAMLAVNDFLPSGSTVPVF